MTESAAIERIRRWLDSGGSLQVLDRSSLGAVLELRTCTGETMETFETNDPDVLELLDEEAAR